MPLARQPVVEMRVRPEDIDNVNGRCDERVGGQGELLVEEFLLAETEEDGVDNDEVAVLDRGVS